MVRSGEGCHFCKSYRRREWATKIRCINVEMEEMEAESKEAVSYDVLLRESGRWMFASVPVEPDLYVWVRFEHAPNMVILWLPDAEKLRTLIKNGKLPAKKVKMSESIKDTVQSIILGDLKPEHLKILASDAEAVLYIWDKPVVLIRITNPKKNR